jgi:thiamine pyrophosphate-dependent acetolactate synthase large subunit-like protein
VVAEAAGVPAVAVTDLAGLDAAMAAATRSGGVRVVVARVPDRAAEAGVLQQIQDSVDGRIGRL